MSGILSYLRTFRHLTPMPQGDGELLQRFRLNRDETAFATLVQRHGPVVLNIARHILGDSDATDDVFQATFLVLARRGRHLETWPSVAGWLVQVTRRTALQTRAKSARRLRLEHQAATMTSPTAPPDPLLHATQRDLAELLDAELARLPGKYRTPLVLCHLHGQTREETARLLGWPVGSVSGRLARGKKLLHDRLLRRGFVPTMVAGVITLPRVEAQVPTLLVQATTLLASNVVHQTTRVSASAAVTLAQGVMTTMLVNKLKYAAAVFVTMALCLGSAVWAWNSQVAPHLPGSVVGQPEPLKGPFADILQGDWVVERTNATQLLSSHVKWPAQPLQGGPQVDLPLHKRRFWKFAGNQVYFMDSWQFLMPVTQRMYTFVPYEIRPYEMDGRATPYQLIIGKLNGIIEIQNGRVNICVRPTIFGPGTAPKQFEDEPSNWNITLRRASDYDRLEGIWRKEERNPVTDEIESAEELIFKKNMYVRRHFGSSRFAGRTREEKPREFVLNESTNPRQIDWEIRSVEEVNAGYAGQLQQNDFNRNLFINDTVKKDKILERQVGIYELKDNEFKYQISGAIPFAYENNKLVPNPKSPLNRRPASFSPGDNATETFKSISVTYKRVERSLKENTNTKLDTPDDPTIKPPPVNGDASTTAQKQPSIQLLDLRKQYLKIAQERMALWNEAYKTGRAPYTELGPISRQLLDASLALATDKEAKVKAMEEHLKVLRQIEQIMESRYKAGNSLRIELLGAQSLRIEFEIQLEELKAGK